MSQIELYKVQHKKTKKKTLSIKKMKSQKANIQLVHLSIYFQFLFIFFFAYDFYYFFFILASPLNPLFRWASVRIKW